MFSIRSGFYKYVAPTALQTTDDLFYRNDQITHHHSMIRIDGLLHDGGDWPEMCVAPDLIDADEWDVIRQSVAPTITRDDERIPNARRQYLKQLITGRQIEIATENDRHVRGHFFHLAREPLELLALKFSILDLFSPAIRRPHVGANAIRMQPDGEHFDL